MLQSFKTFWKNSQTKLWAYAQLAGSGLLASASAINNTINDPTFKSYLDEIDVPKSIILGLAVFGMMTFVFHGHGDDQ